jgi:hypothetical protein
LLASIVKQQLAIDPNYEDALNNKDAAQV